MKKFYFKRVKSLIIVCGFGLIGLGGAAYYIWSKMSVDQQPFYGTVLQQPRPLPAFSLEGTAGYPIDPQHLQGHWTFVFMGFTHCASICPITLAELAKMMRGLAQRPDLATPKVLMITLDPQRDNIVRMKDYVQSFHSDFIGARGTAENVHDLAKYFGIAYTQVNSNVQKHANDYSIEHSGAIMLLNPHGDLVAFFTPPHRADLLIQDYQRLQQR